MEDVGTEEEDPEDFISLIRDNRLSDYSKLFESLTDQLSGYEKENQTINQDDDEEDAEESQTELKEDEEVEITRPSISTNLERTQEHNENKEISTSRKSFPKSVTSTELQKEEDPYTWKKEILENLKKDFPNPYAENIKYDDHFWNEKFYFRKCMEDIFNSDRFLLLGGKGTGKTAFYQALCREEFFKQLTHRAQKKHLHYQATNIISMPSASNEESGKFFEITNFNQEEIRDPEYFYRRFWTIYIWNAIALDAQRLNVQIKIKPQRLFSNGITAKYFKDNIDDDEKFYAIEKELHEIDKQFKESDSHLMIIFDQLDKVVKPNRWDQAISPLIKYCESLDLERIFPKLFVRRDLFKKLGNLTNKISLKNQAINLEWSKEEIYAFFFKVIFAQSKKAFFRYIAETEHSPTVLKKIRQKINSERSYNQLPTDPEMLRLLIETFFGKYADFYGSPRYGVTYDWLYANLKNADNTISLRPFLDLIYYATLELEKTQKTPPKYPIIFPRLFNAEVRIKAVERHAKDLLSEEGNEWLRAVIEDFQGEKIPQQYRYSPLL